MVKAPKDREIIGEFKNYPFTVVCIWNDHMKKWVYASVQLNMMNGKWNDPYFENDYFDEDQLVRWRELNVT